MQSTWYIYFMLFIIVFFIYLPMKRRRKYMANRLFIKKRMMSKTADRRMVMKELIQGFMGKDVYIKLLEGNADGVIKEVTDGGVVLENKNGVQIVNLDYIMKVREYPYKNGKRTTLWGEM